MADFLGRLAERTLGLAEVVQPRPTPLFAPGAPLAGESRDLGAGPAASLADAPPLLQPPGVISPASVPPSSPQPVPAPMLRDEAGTVQLDRRESARSSPTPLSMRLVHGREVLPEPRRQPTPSASVAPPELPLLVPEHHMGKQPELPRMSLSREFSAPGQPISRPAAASRRDQLSPESPPSVHVTIGRIEVLAAPPAPQPARPSRGPVQPTLTIEEYVKQRTQGRR